MIAVSPGLGDHVDRGTLGASVLGGEALGSDLEFLHGLKRKLHDRATDRVVFIVDAIDGRVDIAAIGAVDRKDRIAIFGRVVGVRGFHTGSEISQIRGVAAGQRKIFDFPGRDVLTDAGFGEVDDRRFAGNFNHLRRGARAERQVDGS